MFRSYLCISSSLVYCNLRRQQKNCRRFLCQTERNMKIGTHDGVFHCDEVLACYMLKLLPEFKDADIVRTRDNAKLNECDVVVDVGAIFDHEKKRYDHHQREFNESLSTLKPELGDNYKIKLSSAGLVYTYYGEQIIQHLASKTTALNKSDLNVIYKKVYESLIQEVDAIDNGVPIASEEPRYRIHTSLSNRVGRLNPAWNSKEKGDSNEIFKKAMNLVSEDFLHVVNYYTSIWLPAREFVRKALDERFNVHSSGQILVFDIAFPWKEHLFDLEEEMNLGDELKYVIFNDKPDSWRVQAIPVSPLSFVLRKPLHPNWQGIRDNELSKIAGIEGCIFCHSSGFIGGNVSREGALKMAVQSLKA